MTGPGGTGAVLGRMSVEDDTIEAASADIDKLLELLRNNGGNPLDETDGFDSKVECLVRDAKAALAEFSGAKAAVTGGAVRLYAPDLEGIPGDCLVRVPLDEEQTLAFLSVDAPAVRALISGLFAMPSSANGEQGAAELYRSEKQVFIRFADHLMAAVYASGDVIGTTPLPMRPVLCDSETFGEIVEQVEWVVIGMTAQCLGVAMSFNLMLPFEQFDPLPASAGAGRNNQDGAVPEPVDASFDPDWQSTLQTVIDGIPVGFVAELTRTELPLADIGSLSVGDVVGDFDLSGVRVLDGDGNTAFVAELMNSTGRKKLRVLSKGVGG